MCDGCAVKVICTPDVRLLTLKDAYDLPLNMFAKIIHDVPMNMIAQHGNNEDKFTLQIVHEFLIDGNCYIEFDHAETNVGKHFLDYLNCFTYRPITINISRPCTLELWIIKQQRI